MVQKWIISLRVSQKKNKKIKRRIKTFIRLKDISCGHPFLSSKLRCEFSLKNVILHNDIRRYVLSYNRREFPSLERRERKKQKKNIVNESPSHIEYAEFLVFPHRENAARFRPLLLLSADLKSCGASYWREEG